MQKPFTLGQSLSLDLLIRTPEAYRHQNSTKRYQQWKIQQQSQQAFRDKVNHSPDYYCSGEDGEKKDSSKNGVFRHNFGMVDRSGGRIQRTKAKTKLGECSLFESVTA